MGMSEEEIVRTQDRIKELTYTSPHGIKFLFVHDIQEKLLSPEQFKKWTTVSSGSTCMG